MLHQPRGKGDSDGGSGFGLVDHGELLASLEWRLDGVEELKWDGISLMNI